MHCTQTYTVDDRLANTATHCPGIYNTRYLTNTGPSISSLTHTVRPRQAVYNSSALSANNAFWLVFFKSGHELSPHSIKAICIISKGTQIYVNTALHFSALFSFGCACSFCCLKASWGSQQHEDSTGPNWKWGRKQIGCFTVNWPDALHFSVESSWSGSDKHNLRSVLYYALCES